MSSNKDSDFVNVWFNDGEKAPGSEFYETWTAQASHKHASPGSFGHDALRKQYPGWSIVMSTDYRLDVFGVPGATFAPLKIPLITDAWFVPLLRKENSVPGVLVDKVQVGGFSMSWEGHDFVVYIVTYPLGLNFYTNKYVLHDGPEDRPRLFLLTAGIWANQLHNEIWVFNQGFWNKDGALYHEVQKANWDDVILKDDFKKNLQKDIFGFFNSEELYKKLAIPWKRGLIMHGPPGNGKTISLKAVMKQCGALNYAPLYVRSFQSWRGEEGSMAEVFDKAREMAPCVLILEDLDSLINDRNRSFFLNQLDGISGNDGLLIIGTTNHLSKIDSSLTKRPSRFDRLFLFDDPDREERVLYVKYWQDKLANNEEISFPDSLVQEIASATTKFSFAYLKEAFVSSLVILASLDDKEKPAFASVVKDQIKVLRKQLDQKPDTAQRNIDHLSATELERLEPNEKAASMMSMRNLLSSLGGGFDRRENNAQGKIFTTQQAGPVRDSAMRFESRFSGAHLP
ncbi:P-loop containing nucleoside triphosphate hydrolase protein [Mycena floridula]|nr:P-loop containing nucleoside triphosphate hydrolase protein [Mycena floridula]